MKKVIQVLLGILATILLGAIGSGVWEKILSPAFSFLSGNLTEFLSSVSTSYSDSIYKSASTIKYHGQAGMTLLLLLVVIFFGMLYWTSSKNKNKFISEFHTAMSFHFSNWHGFVLVGVLFFTTFFYTSTQSAVFQIRKYSVKHMDILRPYIGEQQYHFLYSNYLQIKSKDDFDVFIAKVEDYADEHTLIIEKFSFN